MRRPHCASVVASLVLLGGATACGAPDAAPEDAGRARATLERGAAEVGGEVVATIDGTPITLAEVQAAVDASGLAPAEALRRLESERALELRARAAGLDDDPEVEAEERRAAVQVLLARLEAEITPASIPQADVDARLEADRARFERPERRASTHLLVRLPDDADEAARAAATRFAASALARAQAAEDPIAELRALGAEAAGRTFTVIVEDVPAAQREGEVDEGYAAALFSLDAPGLVPRVVQTSYGQHVVVLTEIEPPWSIPRAEAELLVRRQMAVEARAERLVELEDEIRARVETAIDERARQRALTMELGEDGS